MNGTDINLLFSREETINTNKTRSETSLTNFKSCKTSTALTVISDVN